MNICGNIEIPFKVKILETPLICNRKKALSLSPTIAAVGSGLLIGMLTRKWNILLSTLFSTASAAIGYKVCNITSSPPETSAKQEQTRIIVTGSEEICGHIEKILSIMENLGTNKINLADSFSNIIRWYQEAYSSCEEFGEKCSIYYKKRIEKILSQCNYSLHNYDGTNDALFDTTKSINAKTKKQFWPAITGPDGFVMKGLIYIPVEAKL